MYHQLIQTGTTSCVSGDDLTLAQIAKQLNKLEDVVNITELKDGESVCREFLQWIQSQIRPANQ